MADGPGPTGRNRENVIDLTTSTAARPTLGVRPTLPRMAGSDGSINNPAQGRRSSDQILRRRESELSGMTERALQMVELDMLACYVQGWIVKLVRYGFI